MFASPLVGHLATALGALAAVLSCIDRAVAEAAYCDDPSSAAGHKPVASEPQPPSWIFQPSTYSHDPATGARVAQYMRTPPVEPLADQRNVTSRYRRTRTQVRGLDGSLDSSYQVQAWGNGRGGLDAEWERFHDAWKESFLSGGYYNGPTTPYGYGGNPGYGYGGGFGGPGYGGYPGYGYGQPGYGGPGYGGPGYGGGRPGGPGYGPPRTGPGGHHDGGHRGHGPRRRGGSNQHGD